MKPIEYQQRDGMPAQVATEMLTERRARLTNTFRKQCRHARERVIVSSSPIVKVWVEDEGESEILRRCYAEPAERTAESKTMLRCRRATLEQLAKWRRRAIARRAVIQRKYLAVPNSANPIAQACYDAARRDLSLVADRLDTIRDCAESEILDRKRKVNEVEVIRPMFRSVVYFRRKDNTV